jgi:hypothetical protein
VTFPWPNSLPFPWHPSNPEPRLLIPFTIKNVKSRKDFLFLTSQPIPIPCWNIKLELELEEGSEEEEED